jgi:hypothetical protein
MKKRQGTGSDRILRYLEKTDDLREVIDVVNQITQESSVFTKRLSFSYSFNGYIAKDVEIAAGATVKIQHFLGTKPLYRLILNQVGNGVITDIPSDWDNKVISIKNNGGERVILSLLIARE